MKHTFKIKNGEIIFENNKIRISDEANENIFFSLFSSVFGWLMELSLYFDI